ncbi:natural killer cells antigen CD94-like isoform X2 [Chelmon rostratus]|uniref:natural killer cells antigen CD94-like isoform X2 n=1 Tax=Chelmon rostratus TaxID=109905 RepID=UPI001BED0CD8|nr:natural killer cells antigen CD94-like isoform X2 [Chelmon rostratus]
MEEEINYSTVVFKNGGQSPKENKEDVTVYSEVKPKRPTTTVPDGEAAAHSPFRVLAACLGILCVLLVASISAIICISVVMNKQKADISNLVAENQKLITERSVLERETEELSRVNDSLNWTMGVILKFNTFPVNEYCPKKTGPSTLLECNPCKKDWILFQDKCYLFYNRDGWKTWGDSRKYCQATSADLVVVDSLHEQEFLSNHTVYYYDKFHGFWLGLNETRDNNWVWVDGRNDTLSYWMTEVLGPTGPCALMIPGRNLTASWDPAKCSMANKFICESDPLIKSD